MSRTLLREMNRLLVHSNPYLEQEAAIVALLERSIRFGHHKLALRRFFMLKSRDYAVPTAFSQYCENVIRQCSASDVSRIQSSAENWASMVSSRNRWDLDS